MHRRTISVYIYIYIDRHIRTYICVYVDIHIGIWILCFLPIIIVEILILIIVIVILILIIISSVHPCLLTSLGYLFVHLLLEAEIHAAIQPKDPHHGFSLIFG